MNTQENWIIIARFGRPHGIKGFITVDSFTEHRDNILNYANWHAFIKNQWQPIKVVRAEAHTKSIIVQIQGYPERETVAQLTNIEIAVQLEQLKPLQPGEYYWHQLIGLDVINQNGEHFGKVIEMIPTGTHDVLVVEGMKRHLIPYLPDRFVLGVDIHQRLITVDWDDDF